MTDDIVTRLRELDGKLDNRPFSSGSLKIYEIQIELANAANEIERLRAEVSEFKRRDKARMEIGAELPS